jgi:hypothetical protein
MLILYLMGYLHRVHNQKPDDKHAAMSRAAWQKSGSGRCDFQKENQSIHRGTQ